MCDCDSRGICTDTSASGSAFTLISYELNGVRNIALQPDDVQGYIWTVAISDAQPIGTNTSPQSNLDGFAVTSDGNFGYVYVTTEGGGSTVMNAIHF